MKKIRFWVPDIEKFELIMSLIISSLFAGMAWAFSKGMSKTHSVSWTAVVTIFLMMFACMIYGAYHLNSCQRKYFD